MDHAAARTYIGSRQGGGAIFLFLLLLLSRPLLSGQSPPAIAIIIDDMGNQKQLGEAALALPGKVTYAFLPHTPYAVDQARQARRQGRQVMLHLPMQSHRETRLGSGALTLDMTEQELKQTMAQDLDAIPQVAGVNNHMGSLLTRHPGAMAWVMQGLLQRNGLFFVDSRTSRQTVAQQLAREYAVPVTRRDVFLDNVREPAAIRNQFRLLLRKARRQGSAVAIGHPYPETIGVLRQELSRLQQQGVRLVSASEIIRLQEIERPWPEHSSPLPRVVKNSKR